MQEMFSSSSCRVPFVSTTVAMVVVVITALTPFLLPLQTNAHALQQIAGPLMLEMKPGESKSIQWGLLSDNDVPINVSLSSEGIGTEFISLPESIELSPGNITYVQVDVRIPFDHPGAVELKPSLLATQGGGQGPQPEQAGQAIINVQMKKVPSIILAPNENPKFLQLTLKSYPQRVVIDGNEVEILIESTSKISNFVFERENATISFNATGYGGTNGTAISYVGNLLEGPYTLTLDGNAITNVDTVLNNATGQEGIKIIYPHSTHVIEITGGSVVSDFSSTTGTNSSLP